MVSATAADGQISRDVITEVTAEADGLARYTATVSFGDKTYTDTFDKAIPASGTPDQPDNPDNPDNPAPDNPDPDNPDQPAGENRCKWCDEVHTGVWGRIVGFFHSVLYFFAHLFGIRS